MSTPMEQLEALFDQYRANLDKLEKNRRLGDGLFGFGRKPGDDPCHELLDQQVGAFTAQLAETQPSSAETAQVMGYLMRADMTGDWPGYAKWAVVALQRHCLPLVPFLSPEDAGALYGEYRKLYPALQRLPAQMALAKALKKQAAGKPEA